MNKKSLLQLFLIIIILLTSFFFFKTYIVKKDTHVVLENTFNGIDSEEKSNLVYNIQYITRDEDGNSYILESDIGELNDDQKELIVMRGVKAIIESENSEQIIIYSNNAKYNKLSKNTNFYTNVIINFGSNHVTSDKLDFIFEKNLVTISKNIIYKNMDTKLEADKIEIDLLTKNTKIFMDDKSKKIKLIKSN
jgi:lipopolysaccharide export system protein LptA|tara:strand:- start:648 stop:1226 length:579 start_codon:yes stop_codon:yes gene_type:complete